MPIAAPLSPAEEKEATRFGIWDEDRLKAFQDLADHWGDELLCIQCEQPASLRRFTRCCSKRSEFCQPHFDHDMAVVGKQLAERGGVIVCKHCKHEWKHPQTVEDVFRVVPL